MKSKQSHRNKYVLLQIKHCNIEQNTQHTFKASKHELYVVFIKTGITFKNNVFKNSKHMYPTVI